MNKYLTEYQDNDGLWYGGPKIEAINEIEAEFEARKIRCIYTGLRIIGRDVNHSDWKTDTDFQPGTVKD